MKIKIMLTTWKSYNLDITDEDLLYAAEESPFGTAVARQDGEERIAWLDRVLSIPGVLEKVADGYVPQLVETSYDVNVQDYADPTP